MSSNRKALKITSLIQVIIAVLAFALGCIAIAGADYADAEAGIFGVLWANIEGILYIICGALTLVTAVLGIHGANRPSRLGSHRLLALLAALLGIATCVFAGAGAGIPWVGALIVVAAVAAVVLDTLCRKELDR